MTLHGLLYRPTYFSVPALTAPALPPVSSSVITILISQRCAVLNRFASTTIDSCFPAVVRRHWAMSSEAGGLASASRAMVLSIGSLTLYGSPYHLAIAAIAALV